MDARRPVHICGSRSTGREIVASLPGEYPNRENGAVENLWRGNGRGSLKRGPTSPFQRRKLLRIPLRADTVRGLRGVGIEVALPATRVSRNHPASDSIASTASAGSVRPELARSCFM